MERRYAVAWFELRDVGADFVHDAWEGQTTESVYLGHKDVFGSR